MGAVVKWFRNADADDRLRFHCPGCNDVHDIRVAGVRPSWGWNGSLDKPTFSPSVLVRCGHYATDRWKPGDGCWCTYNAAHPDDPSPFKCYLCHSYVTDGMIQFLDDCSHALAGKTVPLPDFPEGVV